MYTLVVIDMQEYFVPPKTQAIVNIKKEIKQAISKKAGILFVEYEGFGSTCKELTCLTKGYKRKFVVTKKSNGGGLSVKQALISYGLPKANLKVCGVNTDYCVLETVAGVIKNLPTTRVEILGKACDSNANHEGGLGALRELKHVKVKS